MTQSVQQQPVSGKTVTGREFLAQLANQQQSVSNAIAKSLEFVPRKFEAGAYPGWEFRFALTENSTDIAMMVLVRARELFGNAMEEFNLSVGGKIRVKIIASGVYDDPPGLSIFPAWLRGQDL